ncbi:calcium-binding protein [Roseicitreum antarcticum]|uniref:Hemolysin-type calcium-binding repeat-containing protein n=1 Tax=Roseicitreum antarcticum TaxID=564137 RepID=A0A1H3ETK3_9RHOB|nr:calcium-binding protein [Roseicitreum antarcticum]SDX82101.1 Hemolysin-type calcium-binding repeat-containing protein [Roseicitreum antarcticum]
MWLRYEGRVLWGIDGVDTPLSALSVSQTAQGWRRFARGGIGDGIVTYRLTPEGVQALTFPGEAGALPGGGRFDALPTGSGGDGGPLLITGHDGQGLFGHAIGPAGQPGSLQHLTWDMLHRWAPSPDAGTSTETSTGNGAGDSFGPASQAWAAMMEVIAAVAPDRVFAEAADVAAFAATGAAGQGPLVQMSFASQPYLLTACPVTHMVISFRADPISGLWGPVDALGATQGLGINTPTALEVVQAHGATWAVVASARSSSVSVMRVGADGGLTATDHVIDTGQTRFGAVQALSLVRVGDQVFVLAGGGDHGLTLFALLPDGRLTWLDTAVHGSFGAPGGDGLYNIAALQAVVQGDSLHVFATSQRNAGLTQFSIALNGPCIVAGGSGTRAEWIPGSAGADILTAHYHNDWLGGGAGHDILVAGSGATYMRGSTGGDTFVMRAGSGPTHVLDFERGVDRLDLSAWPMLRDPAQLTFQSTTTGARLSYRGEVINLTAADLAPLTLAEVFPNGFAWPDSLLILSVPAPTPATPTPPAPPGVVAGDAQLLNGTPGDDVLLGGTGDGHDQIVVTAGRNEIWAGADNDTIYAGYDNDVVDGGVGDDVITAGRGFDVLTGGDGADTFVFYGNSNWNNITDFNGAEGDTLALGLWMWSSQGSLTAQQVVDQFGRINPLGNVVLDFGPAETQIHLVGYTDLAGLADHIDIVA